MNINIRINRWEIEFRTGRRGSYEGYKPALYGGARIDCVTEPKHYYMWWFGTLTLKHHDWIIEKLAAKGCQVLGGVGCHYRSEAGYCEPCKAQLRINRARGVAPKSETWGERAVRERKYIRI